MTLQQWLFSFKGRISRRAFWFWIALWIGMMLLLFTLANANIIALQNAAFLLVCLLWPTAAIVVKRLHDRDYSGVWAFMFVIAWLLYAGNWQMLPEWLALSIGKVAPTFILIAFFVELGLRRGIPAANRFGSQTQSLSWR